MSLGAVGDGGILRGNVSALGVIDLGLAACIGDCQQGLIAVFDDIAEAGAVLALEDLGECAVAVQFIVLSDAAAVDTALAAGDFSALSGLAVSTVQAAKAGGFSGTVADLTGSSATIFTVVFDTQAAGDALNTAKNYIKSETVTQNTYSGTDIPTTANFDSSFAKSSWTAVAPEPTSGLLMLVGLGALALRRRRA
jgi:hypothetical protein